MAVAQTSAQSSVAKDDSRKVTSLASKKIELVKSNKNIEIQTSKGKTVSLPKIEKKIVEEAPTVLVHNNLLADAADVTRSFDNLKKLLIERKEMEEFSSLFGVTITDASLLDLYREASDWIGTRYRRGGSTRKGVDCSGFTGIIYKAVFGVKLDRVSGVIAKNVSESLEKEDLSPGDMVFFATRGRKNINHVGVYIGEGKFVHASISQGVIVSSLDEPYYSRSWRKGGRI